MSPMETHRDESARVAREAHVELMRVGRGGPGSSELYLYYRPGKLGAFSEAPPGWTLGSPERIPGNLTERQLVAWFEQRTGNLPYLQDEP